MEISPTVSISDIKFSVSRKVEDFSRHRKKNLNDISNYRRKI